MKIKHTGCTAVLILAVFAMLSPACTPKTSPSSRTAADPPSEEQPLAAENSSDTADSLPEAPAAAEVSDAEGRAETSEDEPAEPDAQVPDVEESLPYEAGPPVELPEKLVIDEITPYLDFFFERDSAQFEPEQLYRNRDYIAARENFSFVSGRQVEPRYFPVILNYPIGFPDGMFIPDEAGFSGNKVHINTAPPENLTVRAQNTLDGKVYSHPLKAEDFYTLPSGFNDNSDLTWWEASFPFLPTYFLTEQRFAMELVGSDGSIITAGESEASLESGIWNAPVTAPRVSPFEKTEMGFKRNQTMYLPRLPKAPSYLILYMQIRDLLFPVASIFLESEPSAEEPIELYFGPEFPFGIYAFEVIETNSVITSQYTGPPMATADFREEGYLITITSITGFNAP